MENLGKGHMHYFYAEHGITIQYNHDELYNLNNKVNFSNFNAFKGDIKWPESTTRISRDDLDQVKAGLGTFDPIEYKDIPNYIIRRDWLGNGYMCVYTDRNGIVHEYDHDAFYMRNKDKIDKNKS